MSEKEPSAAPVTSTQLQEFGKGIADAITAGIAESRPKKVSFGQYDPKSPWQPDKRKAHKLTRECYQNGYRMNAAQLTNDEIDYLNRISRSGRYINRLVEVVIQTEGSDESVDLRYNNKRDRALEMRGHVRDLADMLRQIVDAQDQENAEDAEAKIVRRPFGNSAATREARARAGLTTT